MHFHSKAKVLCHRRIHGRFGSLDTKGEAIDSTLALPPLPPGCVYGPEGPISRLIWPHSQHLTPSCLRYWSAGTCELPGNNPTSVPLCEQVSFSPAHIVFLPFPSTSTGSSIHPVSAWRLQKRQINAPSALSMSHCTAASVVTSAKTHSTARKHVRRPTCEFLNDPHL
jgi:hypothetical protein